MHNVHIHRRVGTSQLVFRRFHIGRRCDTRVVVVGGEVPCYSWRRRAENSRRPSRSRYDRDMTRVDGTGGENESPDGGCSSQTTKAI